MMKADAVVKPLMTGAEIKLTRKPVEAKDDVPFDCVLSDEILFGESFHPSRRTEIEKAKDQLGYSNEKAQ